MALVRQPALASLLSPTPLLPLDLVRISLSHSLAFSLSRSLTLSLSHYLNLSLFPLFIIILSPSYPLTLSLSHSLTLPLSHSLTHSLSLPHRPTPSIGAQAQRGLGQRRESPPDPPRPAGRFLGGVLPPVCVDHVPPSGHGQVLSEAHVKETLRLT
jgi:hypothetical protein